MAGTLILLIPFPMLFASMLNSKIMKKPTIFKSVYFLPALTSVVVAGTIFRLMFGEMGTSLANQIIGAFGFAPIRWLQNQGTGYFALFTLACWRWTGVNILYFLAGLQSIPQDLYEAASIDGATKWQQFKKITFPLLKPTTVYVLTISIYAGLSMFLESFMIWKGNNSPRNIGLTIVGYLYRQGIERRALGYACAVGLVLLVVVLIVNLIQLTLTGTFKKEGK
jgi:arabinosaccharide transport system permease protein